MAKNKSGNKGQKQPVQKPTRQRVQVMGPTGKLRMEWRPL